MKSLHKRKQFGDQKFLNYWIIIFGWSVWTGPFSSVFWNSLMMGCSNKYYWWIELHCRTSPIRIHYPIPQTAVPPHAVSNCIIYIAYVLVVNGYVRTAHAPPMFVVRTIWSTGLTWKTVIPRARTLDRAPVTKMNTKAVGVQTIMSWITKLVLQCFPGFNLKEWLLQCDPLGGFKWRQTMLHYSTIFERPWGGDTD